MVDISKIDKNFEVKSKIEKDDIKFYDVDESPFKVYGIFKENGKYRRMPENVAKKVNNGVKNLHANTAGGRVRFVTNSPYIAIHAEMDGLGKMPHFAFTGSIGFDMYSDNKYSNTFEPPFNIEAGYEGVAELGESKYREITINFPLYSNVKKLYIGLKEGSDVKEAKPYINELPVVYYGSSITQGGCASRPGMSYQAIVSREFNIDYINLGFSGSARAEDEMIEYIKNLDMSVFVYDYDHNAPTFEHLENTHEKMFKAVREAHPDIPIIIMSRPKFVQNEVVLKRRQIIEKTYNNALASSDKNVYFLDGLALTELCRDEGTVDGTHPTDFGFNSMANAIIKLINENDILHNIKLWGNIK